jgi:hypothetical protein
MDATQIELLARQLYETQGPKAIATAAKKALKFERAGDDEQARAWRRVEAALELIRGPRET